MNIEDLKIPFPAKQVHWRQGGGGKQLAYINSRDVMKRLDDVCGVNWQCRYPFPGCCEIGIKIDDEWLWRSNGAGETSIEGEKGQYSDAFKRAAVTWGVGRYLYYLTASNSTQLPEWATPEGYSKMMEKKND